MFTNQWRACCAVIGAVTFLAAMQARAQEDPFGVADSDPAAVRSAADLGAALAQPPADEKSVLTAELSAKAGAHGQDFCRCVGESDSAAIARIEEALRKPLGSNGLDFTDTPLEEVVNLLQEEYGIPIQIDHAALEATGLDPTEQVTLNIHNVSLRSGLRLMLRKIQLTYFIQDEVLIISTPEQAERHVLTCVYDIRGFVEDTSDKSIDALIDTIVSCVSTESWAENGGGEAEVRPLKPGLLVISQTQAVHDEISSLLHAVREMRDSHAPGDHAAAAPAAGAEEVVTRSYVLQVNQQGDLESLRNQVRELIVQSIPDEQWDGRLADGQPVMLAILGDRVVVRHKPSVQDAVQAIVVDSGVATPATERSNRGGNGGGGNGGGGVFSPKSAKLN